MYAHLWRSFWDSELKTCYINSKHMALTFQKQETVCVIKFSTSVLKPVAIVLYFIQWFNAAFCRFGHKLQ